MARWLFAKHLSPLAIAFLLRSRVRIPHEIVGNGGLRWVVLAHELDDLRMKVLEYVAGLDRIGKGPATKDLRSHLLEIFFRRFDKLDVRTIEDTRANFAVKLAIVPTRFAARRFGLASRACGTRRTPAFAGFWIAQIRAVEFVGSCTHAFGNGAVRLHLLY